MTERLKEGKAGEGRWHHLTACSHFTALRFGGAAAFKYVFVPSKGSCGTPNCYKGAGNPAPAMCLSAWDPNLIPFPASPIDGANARALTSGGTHISGALFMQQLST